LKAGGALTVPGVSETTRSAKQSVDGRASWTDAAKMSRVVATRKQVERERISWLGAVD
jgi:hypothetical protein